MKILFVTPYFFPQTGGVENYVYNIAKRLSKDNEVTIVTSTQHKSDTIEGMKVYRLKGLFKVSNTPINPFWYFQLKKIINQEKPDIINAHTPVPFISDLVTTIAPKKTVVTYHNDLIKEGILNYLCKIYYFLLGNRTLRICNKIIATSNIYVEKSPYLKKLKNKIEIVSPGVDLNTYNTEIEKGFLNKQNHKKIVFVGTLSKFHAHKGVEYLIRALNLIEIEKIHLFICGKGNNIYNLKKVANELGVSDKISFLGFVSDQDLPKIYRDCNIVVLPTYNKAEGFGMVLAEANACGTPVIGSNVGGIPAVIKDGFNGLLVSPRNEKDLANKISYLLSNEKVAREIGKNGAKMAIKSWDWNMLAKKTLGVFKK
jgi:glycosyltransferase involved in cell wall biosynthesis